MSKKIARWAHLVREIAGGLVAVLKVIKLIVELMDKGANCNVCTAH
jgi:hypothetical protein